MAGEPHDLGSERAPCIAPDVHRVLGAVLAHLSALEVLGVEQTLADVTTDGCPRLALASSATRPFRSAAT